MEIGLAGSLVGNHGKPARTLRDPMPAGSALILVRPTRSPCRRIARLDPYTPARKAHGGQCEPRLLAVPPAPATIVETRTKRFRHSVTFGGSSLSFVPSTRSTSSDTQPPIVAGNASSGVLVALSTAQ